MPMPAAGAHVHEMPAMPAPPLGLGSLRDGSGTSWLPDDSPMLGVMRHSGAWMLMLHGSAFVHAIHAGSDRGNGQFGSINWGMGMATRGWDGGIVELRGMVSLESLTVGRCGYPTLLATGETCDGETLHDRQHPHDLLMEVAARYRRAISNQVAFELYGGLAGEPALGPTAFPHRLSAMPNPIAPISHHWLDSTHISFGVATAGLYGRKWKAEGSVFNGREPDDARFDVEPGALDSYAGRLWIMPTSRLVLQVSAGHLEDAEGGDEDHWHDVDRMTASATFHVSSAGGTWATTLAWGHNRESHGSTSAFLVESALDLTSVDTLFVRGEVAGKTADELVLPIEDDEPFTVGKVQAGYTRWLRRGGGVAVGLGGSIGVSTVPAHVQPFYGSRSATEGAAFLTIRPQQ
jgi:hypothetical protein